MVNLMEKKEQKNNKKIIYGTLVLVVIIIAGIFVFIQKTNNPALSSCIKEWKARQSEGLEPSKYATGSIFVNFGSVTTEQEAKQLIQKNGLSILRSGFAEDTLSKNKTVFTAVIEVPINSEIKWLCKFKMHAFVSSASVIPKYD
jgi:hypothetical protein